MAKQKKWRYIVRVTVTAPSKRRKKDVRAFVQDALDRATLSVSRGAISAGAALLKVKASAVDEE